MVKVIAIPDLEKLIAKHGMKSFFRDLIDNLRHDFFHWNDFHKMARLAAHAPEGVVELMPTWNDRLFSYKYVNGHPNNPKTGRLNIVAFGMLSELSTGYPILLSEMTLLTAIRTAAASAMVSDLLARPDVTAMSVIGTGAQSEFQVIAHQIVRPLEEIRYFDLDRQAMDRFHRNMDGLGLTLTPCKSAAEAVDGTHLVTVATAARGHIDALPDSAVKPGLHINGIGGDSPGKTELALATVKRAKIFVEYLPQTLVEGEIQRLTPEERKTHVKGEIWELVTKQKKGRESPNDITLYDAVGFALEDFSTLRLVYDLSTRYKIGTPLSLLPELPDPKDLISLLHGHHRS